MRMVVLMLGGSNTREGSREVPGRVSRAVLCGGGELEK